MYKQIRAIGAVLALVMFAGMTTAADESLATKKCKCPVAGKEFAVADAAASVDYKDATVYFCCGGCKAKFEGDVKKFSAKANKQLVVTGQAKQVKCPIAGRDMNPEKMVTVDNVKVSVCCGGCQGKAEAAQGDAQIELLFSDKAFKKGFEVVKK